MTYLNIDVKNIIVSNVIFMQSLRRSDTRSDDTLLLAVTPGSSHKMFSAKHPINDLLRD